MFKGIQKVSLIDYPGKVAATLFTGGCNFRCPWCHNWSLVEPSLVESTPDMPESYIQNYLLTRKGKLQGVCITGGEPTLWGPQLARFMGWCKNEGYLVKLDTNGYLPDVLRGYIQQKLVDFIAMDIKNSLVNYSKSTGIEPFHPEPILETIQVIKSSGVPYQFRTTMVPELVERENMLQMASLIQENILFQEYRKPVQ